jgi:membrane associated rhomboid family serine protease
VFPIRDENPTLTTSAATFTLIGLNVASWVFLQGLGSEPSLMRSVCTLGAIPGELLGTVAAGTRIPLGSGVGCVISADPNWSTTVTSMFMHGGWFHLIGNLWFLSVFGDNVEDSMGHLRFVVFYLICGIAAVAAQLLSDTHSAVPLVGASGAIGGVMGAYAVLYPRAPVHMLLVLGFFFTTVEIPAVLMLGYWFLLQLIGGIPALQGATGGVAFWAHAGGFVAGIALVPFFRDARRVAAHSAHVARFRRR